jgi:hypothetical protein
MSRAGAVTAWLVLAIVSTSPASPQADLARRVTIDVTELAPQKVFELLARSLDCTITVDPAVKKPLTLRAVDMPATDILVMICQRIKCEYRFDGKSLFIKPLSASRKRQMAATLEHSRKLGSRLPTGMHFDSMPLKDVLDAIGKAAGLELRPWKDEGNRKVTIDVGGKTVDEALEAVVRRIDGEGVVMMRTWAGSWGQHRLVDKRGEP